MTTLNSLSCLGLSGVLDILLFTQCFDFIEGCVVAEVVFLFVGGVQNGGDLRADLLG